MGVESTPIGLRSWTLWGAGIALIGNGLLRGLAMVTAMGLLGDFSQAVAGGMGPSPQIGTGAAMLGIRRRL